MRGAAIIVVAMIVVAIASLATPVAALGHTHHHPYRHRRHHGHRHHRRHPRSAPRPNPLAPTSTELAGGMRAAESYWRTLPSCGMPTVSVGAVTGTAPENGGAGMAQADESTCTIVLAASDDWYDFPSLACTTIVHEYGHLVLGPTYFQATNPADPAHSPDPSSIMYWNPPITATMDRDVGCPIGS